MKEKHFPVAALLLIGQGGTVETIKRSSRVIEIWIEGSPHRPFKIVAKKTSTYSHDTADQVHARNAAKRQMIDAAIENDADAVVFGTDSIDSVGTVYRPGTPTAATHPTSGGDPLADTASNETTAGSVGEDTLHAYFIKYDDKLERGIGKLDRDVASPKE